MRGENLPPGFFAAFPLLVLSKTGIISVLPFSKLATGRRWVWWRF